MNTSYAGPILQRNDMRAIFQKKGKKEQKRAKYLKIWAKMYKIWIYFEKGQPHACDYRMHEAANICPDMKNGQDVIDEGTAIILTL